jgi:TonB family protein
MFQALIESGPRAPVSLRRYLASLGMHGLMVAAAALATRPSLETARPAPVQILMPVQPVVGPPPAPRLRSADLPVPSPTPAWPQTVEVPPLRHSSLSDDLPTVDDLLRADRSGMAPSPDLGSTLDALPAAAVDEPVAVVRQPAPRYPAALAEAGIAGRVELSYVVDTTGSVELGSLRTLSSTHPSFDAAARESVVASRFRPARLHGRLVRQRVTQAISFRLGT